MIKKKLYPVRSHRKALPAAKIGRSYSRIDLLDYLEGRIKYNEQKNKYIHGSSGVPVIPENQKTKGQHY